MMPEWLARLLGARFNAPQRPRAYRRSIRAAWVNVRSAEDPFDRAASYRRVRMYLNLAAGDGDPVEELERLELSGAVSASWTGPSSSAGRSPDA
jgi:hypothetical protein